jgi:putative transposase
MKGTRHREEQIIGILKQGEQDWPPPSYAVSTTLQNRPTIAGKRSAGAWKPGKAKKLKQLEEENRKLKHVVAELTLDNRALKE